MTTKTCIKCGKTKNLEAGFVRCNHQYTRPYYRNICRQCMSDGRVKKGRTPPIKKSKLPIDSTKLFTQLLGKRHEKNIDSVSDD